MSNSNENIKVTIFNRLNKLKLKAGIPIHDDRLGYIDPSAIKRAQTVIDKEESNYKTELETVLIKLESAWDDLKADAGQDKQKTARLRSILHNYANNVKDMADTYNYSLMGYFGRSLRDFCETLDARKEPHQTIVQAHIDVMRVAFEENLKEETTALAEELKRILVKAIEKHSK